MRQPQVSICWSLSASSSSSTMAVPITNPASVPNSRKLPYRPRFLSGAYSAMNVAAPPYSPPVENPWTTRSAINRIGAHTPATACVGSSPMRAVAPEMSKMVMASTAFRPIRSPIGPQIMPPSGRSTKEIANPSIVPMVPRSPGKKACVR